MPNRENKEPSRNRPILFICLGLGLVLAACVLLPAYGVWRSAFVYIQPDQRGVVISALEPQGYRPDPLEPGPHWITPFVESVRLYSIAPQTYVMSAQSIPDDSINSVTRDGQEAFLSVSVRYTLDPDKLLDLHINWQDYYQDRLVRPLVRRTTRDTVRIYNTVELTSKRSELEQAISVKLSQEFATNDLILLDFAIEDIRIP